MVAVVSAISVDSIADDAAPAVKATFTWRHEETIPHDYLVFLPDGYEEAPATKRWPLLVYLHGGGGNEAGVRRRLAPLKKEPFIILAPICPPLREGEKWIYQSWDPRIVGAIVNQVLEDYLIDKGRCSLMGFSMGGSAAWAMPYWHPEMFDKVVVISGSCHPWKLKYFPKIPVRTYSGKNEPWLPQHTNSVETAKSFGVDVAHTIWPGADHGECCRRTLADESLWRWLRGEPAEVAAPENDSPRPDSTAKGSLIICGGGGLPDQVVARFVELAGGADGQLVVIPTAAEKVDESDKSALVRRWTERGLGSVSVLHTRDRAVADSPAFIDPLKSATAVWFGGGLQSRLADAYVGTATERAILDLFRRGGVIGGTSAGAAIQSRVMIQSGNPVPKITTGLDLLPRAIIDQHFLYRNRFNRLLSAVGQHPGRTGVGIDEATAIVFHGGECQVLGESYVTVVQSGSESKLSVQTFRSGQAFNLDRATSQRDASP